MGKNTGAAIDRARAALADTEAKITDITAKRAARGRHSRRDRQARRRTLRYAAATERDRIALLEQEVGSRKAATSRCGQVAPLFDQTHDCSRTQAPQPNPAPEKFFAKTPSAERLPPFRRRTVFGHVFGGEGMTEICK